MQHKADIKFARFSEVAFRHVHFLTLNLVADAGELSRNLARAD